MVDLLEPYRRLFPGLDRCIDAVAGQPAAGGVGEELLRWRMALRDLLATNAEVVRTRFNHVVTDLPAWHGEFNTFVRVPALTGHDHLTTTHRLFREHGLSFALPNELWIQGLTRLDHAVRADDPVRDGLGDHPVLGLVPPLSRPFVSIGAVECAPLNW